MSLFRRVTDPEFPVKAAFSRWTIFTSFAYKTPGVTQGVRDRELGKTPSCGREECPRNCFGESVDLGFRSEAKLSAG